MQGMSKKKKKGPSLAKRQRLNYLKDNIAEDRAIKSLEKKLKLNKKKSKAIPQSFVSDGLDYLLEICDENSRKVAAEAEKQLVVGTDSESDEESSKKLDKKKNRKEVLQNTKKEKQKVMKKRKTSTSEESDEEEFDKESDEEFDQDFSDGDGFEEEDIDEDVEPDTSLPDSNPKLEEDNETWEDIYGRKRDREGNIITKESSISGKYVPPAARLKELESSAAKNENLLRLRRQIKGLLNRLSESNMKHVCSQLEDMYMNHSRNDMNEMLCTLMMESIVAPVITPNRLVTEHIMCVAILHANIGTEVGAHFILSVVKRFMKMMGQNQEVENKELDNIVLMISHLYNFQVFGSQLVYQLLDKLAEKFTEKEIELILLILKTVGFVLRKDDPLALKKLILSLQQKAAADQSTSFRTQFMLDVLLAIKNNNVNKIPQYDPSYTEHLKKILKNFIRKGNGISQLNLTLQDLLNADEHGKWWIVGSSWSGNVLPNDSVEKKSSTASVFSKKILELAKAQRMNTDTRKNIFCIIMTAEDYLDAFEKLHHLGLKNHQEKEIIYVILNCCLQEKSFNPFYAILAQKFCDFNRKYHMAIQFTLWDKFKILNTFNKIQMQNLAKFISFLIIKKGLSLTVLKVIEFGELDKITTKFLKTIILDILLHENAEVSLEVFKRISTFANLQHFREGLRLFINHFLIKNLKSLTTEQKELLKQRIDLADRILMTTRSQTIF